ncbi:MAG: FAD-binding protein [Burkholderiales bacterium]|nr:FAD-binding protein [Burkholderiales bacterium]
MSAIGKHVDEVRRTDVLVIGSEGTGARAAIAAADSGCKVLVATKGFVGKCGATLTADADIDVDSGTIAKLFALSGAHPDDSPQKFFEDMVKEGDWIGNQRLVQIHCEEAGPRVKELVDWGARVDKLTHAPGHRYPRGIWIEGPEIAKALTKQILARPAIALLETTMVTDLLLRGGRCVGAIGLDYRNGKVVAFEAGAVIICTGGAMRMYRYTTAPDELTGDGMAAAYRAGAELQDMEFPMFLPYVMIKPDAVNSIDFPYLLSAYLDAKALNRMGQEYMNKWDKERLAWTTRDVNSIAAMVEVLEGRGGPNDGTYISLKHLPRNIIANARAFLPEMIGRWRYGAFDMKKFLPDLNEDAIECAPASHFWNGGVRVNEHCETCIPGLYAAGEGTGGFHGGNRVSGNALTMTQVWGPRAGLAAAKFSKQDGRGEVDPAQVAALRAKIMAPMERATGSNPIELRNRVRHLAHRYLNAVREQRWLEHVLQELKTLQDEAKSVHVRDRSLTKYNMEWVEALQTENLLAMMEMVARGSLMRTESRGAMFRRDFPDTDGVNWLKNIIIRRDGDAMRLRTEPAVVTTLQPPRTTYRYSDQERV